MATHVTCCARCHTCLHCCAQRHTTSKQPCRMKAYTSDNMHIVAICSRTLHALCIWQQSVAMFSKGAWRLTKQQEARGSHCFASSCRARSHGCNHNWQGQEVSQVAFHLQQCGQSICKPRDCCQHGRFCQCLQVGNQKSRKVTSSAGRHVMQSEQ